MYGGGLDGLEGLGGPGGLRGVCVVWLPLGVVIGLLPRATSFRVLARVGTAFLCRCMLSYRQSRWRVGWWAKNTLGLRAQSLERLIFTL